MRIGIDLDDTICETTEIVQDRVEKYAKFLNIDPLDIMNNEELRKKFFQKYLDDIYTNVEVKKNAIAVLKRLKSRGNEIYIITARGDTIPTETVDIYKITEEWFLKHNILVDKIIISTYGDKKREACRENKIDLMIDDDPYNYKKVISLGINCLLFDDHGRFNLEKDYVTNWLDVEKYIERNR